MWYSCQMTSDKWCTCYTSCWQACIVCKDSIASGGSLSTGWTGGSLTARRRDAPSAVLAGTQTAPPSLDHCMQKSSLRGLQAAGLIHGGRPAFEVRKPQFLQSNSTPCCLLAVELHPLYQVPGLEAMVGRPDLICVHAHRLALGRRVTHLHATNIRTASQAPQRALRGVVSVPGWCSASWKSASCPPHRRMGVAVPLSANSSRARWCLQARHA